MLFVVQIPEPTPVGRPPHTSRIWEASSMHLHGLLTLLLCLTRLRSSLGFQVRTSGLIESNKHRVSRLKGLHEAGKGFGKEAGLSSSLLRPRNSASSNISVRVLTTSDDIPQGGKQSEFTSDGRNKEVRPVFFTLEGGWALLTRNAAFFGKSIGERRGNLALFWA